MVRLSILAALASVLAFGATAQAQDSSPFLAIGLENPIETREHLMESNGAAAQVGAAMLKGEIPYDPAKARMVFRSMNDVAYAFGHYFPEGSETGGETRAAPAIWEQPDEFRAQLAKFAADTEAALAADPQDVAAFQPLFGQVTQNCGGCHRQFRLSEE